MRISDTAALAVVAAVMAMVAGCSASGGAAPSAPSTASRPPVTVGGGTSHPATPAATPGANGALGGWTIRSIGRVPIGDGVVVTSDGRYVVRPARQYGRRTELVTVTDPRTPLLTHDPGRGWHTEDVAFTARWLFLIDKQDEKKGHGVRGVRIDPRTGTQTVLPPPGAPRPTALQSWSVTDEQVLYPTKRGGRECLVVLDLTTLGARPADCAAPGEVIEYLTSDAGHVAFTGNRPKARAEDGRSCRTIYSGPLGGIGPVRGQTPCWGFAGAAVPGGTAWHEETHSDVFDALGPLMFQTGQDPPRRIEVPEERDGAALLGSLQPCRGWIYAVVEHSGDEYTEIQRWKPGQADWQPVYRSPDPDTTVTTGITCHAHGIGFARSHLGEDNYEEALVAPR